MKKHATTILLFVVMFVGLGLLLYPPLADYYNSFHQSRAIASYVQAIEMDEGADYSAYWQDARDYNAELANINVLSRLNGSARPTVDYDDLLKVNGSEVMGVIEIPAIAVTLPLYHGTSEMVLQVAVGHLEGTSLPTGDPGTHAAFSAHRGLPSAKLFTNLDQLEKGDLFTIRVIDQIMTYEIDQIVIVLPHEVEALEIYPGESLCSLITCTPYGVNSHRLIVRGHRVVNSDAEMAARVTADATQIDPLIVTPVVAAPMLVVLLIVMLVNTSPKKKRAKARARKTTTEELAAMFKDKYADAMAGENTQKDSEEPETNSDEGGERP